MNQKGMSDASSTSFYGSSGRWRRTEHEPRRLVPDAAEELRALGGPLVDLFDHGHRVSRARDGPCDGVTESVPNHAIGACTVA